MVCKTHAYTVDSCADRNQVSADTKRDALARILLSSSICCADILSVVAFGREVAPLDTLPDVWYKAFDCQSDLSVTQFRVRRVLIKEVSRGSAVVPSL